MMDALIFWLHWAAGFVVLAESVNKLERMSIFGARSARDQCAQTLKALAWFCLALGAGGAVATPVLLVFQLPANLTAPLLRLEFPTLAETLVLVGFAVLIVRTRIKEG